MSFSNDLGFESNNRDAGPDLFDIEWDKELIDGLVVLASTLLSDDEDFASAYLMAREVEEIQELVDEGHYAPALVRQSAFFEQLLTEAIQSKFEEIQDRDLFNAEQAFVGNLGHKNRIQLAHLLNVIDQRERDMLLSMATWRNEAAHSWWYILEKNDKKQLRDTATSIQKLLNEMLEEDLKKLE